MSSCFLKPSEKRELLEELRSSSHKRYADRIRVILLLDRGETYKDISSFLFLDEGSIANYKSRYKEGGLDKLITDDYLCKRSFLTEKQLCFIREELKRYRFSSSKRVLLYIKERFGIEY